ncbi:MAG: acetyl-CoA acetyltransferase [Acidimicrobiales bacterium]
MSATPNGASGSDTTIPSGSTPVIVGVGQVSERIGEENYGSRSPADLGGDAAREALTDAGVPASSVAVIAATRQFENSNPMAVAPLGRADNYPRAVAGRIGAEPAHAIQEIAGGQSPQHLVSELAARIAAGECSTALVVGAEAISTAAHLKSLDDPPSWAETVGGQLEDRGFGIAGMLSRLETMHGLNTAPAMYAVCENARRRAKGMSSQELAREMGELFARFSEIAAANPHSAAPTRRSADELVTATDKNRMVAHPYTRYLIARDKVNQGAAVLMMSADRARELGVPPDRWTFLHGHADLVSPPLLERPDLGAYPAGVAAVRHALEVAGIGLDDVGAFDFYSCFPAPVLALCDGLGLAIDDPRGLTLTGGLPFFGGPGNNYSLHGIAEAVAFVREHEGARAVVAANGGVLSKCSVGVYSAQPRPWHANRSADVQARLDTVEKEKLVRHPDGEALVETFTVVHSRDTAKGIVVGRLAGSGGRFLSTTLRDDETMVELLTSESVFDTPIHVRSFGRGNRVTTTSERMDHEYPPEPLRLRDDYENVQVRRDGHLLEVTIDRPEARNALTPQAHEELGQIFDTFFADDDLWVAILTGAGDRAFSAGADLKYGASGKPVWVPKGGFGGLTSRRSMSKPVIAAVNGFAFGGGFEMALACHLVVADETATFALSEVKVGLFAAAGGVVRLPRAIPRHLANELILTGRPASAEELHRHGLVARVAPEGKALETARELAEEILAVSPTSVRVSLQAMKAGDTTVDAIDAIDAGDDAIDNLLLSADMVEGMKAFAEKRPPEWQNR